MLSVTSGFLHTFDRVSCESMQCSRAWRLCPRRFHPNVLLSIPSRACPARGSICYPSISQRRRFGLESIPAVLLPPAVFGGLLVTLWTYKCLMMVIFQNKIIYMPSVPPFSRSEKVSDYERQCSPIVWTEHDLKAADGTAIKLLEGTVGASSDLAPEVVVLYFQGYVHLFDLKPLSELRPATPLHCPLGSHIFQTS